MAQHSGGTIWRQATHTHTLKMLSFCFFFVLASQWDDKQNSMCSRRRRALRTLGGRIKIHEKIIIIYQSAKSIRRSFRLILVSDPHTGYGGATSNFLFVSSACECVTYACIRRSSESSFSRKLFNKIFNLNFQIRLRWVWRPATYKRRDLVDTVKQAGSIGGNNYQKLKRHKCVKQIQTMLTTTKKKKRMKKKKTRRTHLLIWYLIYWR